jgi:hypothetical protein
MKSGHGYEHGMEYIQFHDVSIFASGPPQIDNLRLEANSSKP